MGGPVTLPETIIVKELAERLQLAEIDVVKQLMRNGVMANVTQVVDYETAALVAEDLGYAPSEETKRESQDLAALHARAVGGSNGAGEKEGEEGLETRPPVVTILGHVDHGKTTLLDAIRETRVAEGEAGGITQHIGAYQVMAGGRRITFLDTPGHEAFTSMRARGARVTDIAVLVVAADDGVMPQTVEAIDHAKAAGVPIIVAINKMDRAEANAERVKLQLTERGLVLEEWGGEVIAVPVSARTGEGLERLLENLLVVAEVSELRADPDRLAAGVVIEANVDRTRGPVATLLVQAGTLRVGDPVVAGDSWGRVKAMMDEGGRRLREAGPATPVVVLGLDGLPGAGDPFVAFGEDRKARAFVQERERVRERLPSSVMRAPTLEELSGRVAAGEVRDLPLILKTDVQGSVEPVRESLERLSTGQAKVRLLHVGAGSINESDVLLAIASGATIIGFNAPVEAGARALAAGEGVELRSYTVIYTLVEEMGKALEGILEPVVREVTEGHGEVRAVFTVGRRGAKVAGTYVTDGQVTRGSRCRVVRGGERVCEGAIGSLKRFKNDTREVGNGLECGIGITGCDLFEEGDTLEFYHLETAPP